MKNGLFVLTAATLLSLSACKKHDDSANASGAATPATTAAAPAAPVEAVEPTADAIAKSEAQAKLEYATMEDSYINDPKGQWATSAQASSAFGDADKEPADSHSSNTPWQATGTPNGDAWINNHQDIGFDWLQTTYDKPTSATEVRVVFTDNVEAVSKIELIDAGGTAHTVWSGVSDTRKEDRGARTWVVRKFEATPYLVKSVKVTVANPVATGYKNIDAVQLVGA